jgi:uncharacterized membrane protein YeaQ/YmgE (transglycosylase-associated protein family)
MTPLIETFVVVTNSVTLICGGLVTLLAARAYRRTGATALGALAAGLGFITVGALVAGVLHQLFDVGFAAGVSVQSLFTAAGFAIMAYSLYANWQPPTGAHGGTEIQ